MGAQYVCVPFSARQIPARWSGLVCVRSGESEEKAERMREEKETPFPSFPYGEWWKPIVGCLEFLR